MSMQAEPGFGGFLKFFAYETVDFYETVLFTSEPLLALWDGIKGTAVAVSVIVLWPLLLVFAPLIALIASIRWWRRERQWQIQREKS